MLPKEAHAIVIIFLGDRVVDYPFSTPVLYRDRLVMFIGAK